jgi:flagellar motor switch protein FliG
MSREPIQGQQRVAALLLSLEPAVARGILQTLPEDVVARVAAAMTEPDPRLGEQQTLGEVYRDLARAVHGPRAMRALPRDELGRLLSDSLGAERGGAVLKRIGETQRREQPFAALEARPPERVAELLAHESNAVCATVLSSMHADAAAAILRLLEAERAQDVVCRMAVLEPRPPALLHKIAEELGRALETATPETSGPDAEGRMTALAALLNNCPPELEKGIFDALSQKDAELAAELRERMFTWEELATIDKRAMQKILGTVDTKTLSIALKACSPAVEQNVLGNLSTRARAMVVEERELAGPMPMTDVRAARQVIMTSIRAMIESGEFRPHRGGEELV